MFKKFGLHVSISIEKETFDFNFEPVNLHFIPLSLQVLLSYLVKVVIERIRPRVFTLRILYEHGVGNGISTVELTSSYQSELDVHIHKSV